MTRFPIKRISVSLGLFFLFLLLICAIYVFNHFKIKKIQIVSNSANIRGLAVLNNRNLLLLNKKKVIDFLLQQNPQWKSVNLDFVYPSTLLLTAAREIPIAKIKGSSDTFITAMGRVITDFRDGNNLPEIESDQINIYNENRPDWRVIKAAEYIKMADENYVTINKIEIDNRQSLFKLHLQEGTLVFIRQRDNPQRIVASLQTIISRFRIEGKIISVINFQFDKPVVTLVNEEKNNSIKGL